MLFSTLEHASVNITSDLVGWVKKASCCILDSSLSYSCRLKVKLTGHLWLSLWDTVDTVVNEGSECKTK